MIHFDEVVTGNNRVWVESTYQNEISAFMLVNGYFLVAGLSQS